MKVSTVALVTWTLASTSDAFVIPSSSSSAKTFVRSISHVKSVVSSSSSSSSLQQQQQQQQSHEFEYLLHENGLSQNTMVAAPRSSSRSRSRRVVTTTSVPQKKVQLMSSSSPAVADVEEDIDQEMEDYLNNNDNEEERMTTTSEQESDESEIMSTQDNNDFGDTKLSQFQEEQGVNKFGQWLSQADFQEVAWTLVVPSLAAFAVAKWGYGKLDANLSQKAHTGLESFANELIYHDGNFDEMQLCKQDWDGKLAWLGPSKKKRMLSTYLEDYAKRKPVSPQAISSISYAFTLFGLSEEQAADAMVKVCQEGGTERISSANKLLFFGTHIFKSAEAKDKLTAIKTLIKSTYRSEAGADTIVDTSQYAMGESAYRNVVQKTGGSSKLPDGWQVLGLTKAAAQQIYDEEKESGFKSAKDELYGSLNERYNKKGQRIDENGYVIEEKDQEQNERDAEFDSEKSNNTSGAYECGNCGYTLFVAAGREAKFFGAGFVCPECGAAKDEFTEVEDMDLD